MTHLAELLQVELERLHVHVEAQRGHGEEDVLAVDGLPLLLVAPLAGLRRDEADELAHALLHALLGVFRYLDRTDGKQRKRKKIDVSFDSLQAHPANAESDTGFSSEPTCSIID